MHSATHSGQFNHITKLLVVCFVTFYVTGFIHSVHNYGHHNKYLLIRYIEMVCPIHGLDAIPFVISMKQDAQLSNT